MKYNGLPFSQIRRQCCTRIYRILTALPGYSTLMTGLKMLKRMNSKYDRFWCSFAMLYAVCGVNQTQYKVHCYWLSLSKRSWNEAAKFCKRKGGVLSDLIDINDLEFFSKFLATNLVSSIWIDFSKNFEKERHVFKEECWRNDSIILSPLALCCSYGPIHRFNLSNCLNRKKFACKLPAKDSSLRNLIRVIRNTDEEDEYSEVRKPLKEYPLLVFRVTAFSTLLIFVGSTIIIYITTRMFYLECIAHISSEIALFGAFVCILITTCESRFISHSFCLTVSILLQFFFMVVFLCHLLESVIISRMLLLWFPKYLFANLIPLIILGWGLPLAITIISAISAHNKYIISTENCWMEVESNLKWATIIPIGIFVGINIVLLLNILFIKEVPKKIRPENEKRARVAFSTRWASSIIIIFLIVVWSTGLMATYKKNETFFGIFCVCTIFLGVVIFILRISTEEEVRKRISAAFTNQSTVMRERLWVTTPMGSDNISLYSHLGKTWPSRLENRK